MASKLYKIKKPDVDSVKNVHYFNCSSFFQPSKFGNFIQYFIDILPSRLVCCRMSRRQRGIRKALEAMDGENDIVEWIKKRRFFSMALEKLLTKKERMDIK